MDRFNDSDLIELGSVTTDTQGPPPGEKEDILGPKRDVSAGLSDD